MKATLKRFAVGFLVALMVATGIGLGANDALAYTRVLRSDDGKLVLICYYDDRTGELAFCDVYYFPNSAGNSEIIDGGDVSDGGGNGGTRVGADEIVVAGNQLTIEDGAVDGVPDGTTVTAPVAKKPADKAKAPGKKKHGAADGKARGKGTGHGKTGGKNG